MTTREEMEKQLKDIWFDSTRDSLTWNLFKCIAPHRKDYTKAALDAFEATEAFEAVMNARRPGGSKL
jgi:hypothetical protein